MTKGKYIRTNEIKNKMRLAKLGKPLSDKQKAVLIKMHQITKGKRCSEERKEKIRISKLGKQRSDMIGNKINLGRIPWNKGKTNIYSEETLNRFKEARKLIILPFKDTSIEVKIQGFLKQLGIDFFTHQYIKEIKHGYQCDILIPSMNMIIECDGNYWHKYPIGKEIDHVRTKELIEKGFKVLRLWEFEIKQMNVNDFKIKIFGDNCDS